jgi:hypothetical protein
MQNQLFGRATFNLYEIVRAPGGHCRTWNHTVVMILILTLIVAVSYESSCQQAAGDNPN